MHPMKTRVSRSPAVAELYSAAEAYLEEDPLVPVPAFEEMLHDRFRTRWEEGDFGNLTGSSRLKWQNLVDWVKARLTGRGYITYVRVRGHRYILYLKPVGSIDKHG